MPDDVIDGKFNADSYEFRYEEENCVDIRLGVADRAEPRAA